MRDFDKSLFNVEKRLIGIVVGLIVILIFAVMFDFVLIYSATTIGEKIVLLLVALCCCLWMKLKDADDRAIAFFLLIIALMIIPVKFIPVFEYIDNSIRAYFAK